MIRKLLSRFLPKSSKTRRKSSQDATQIDSVPEATAAGDRITCRQQSEAVHTANGVENGFFRQATNFTINGANMFDHPQIFQTIHDTITTGAAALDRLLPYTCPDAAVDSSARDPPPRCHPGTRQRILNILNDWLINYIWKIFWLCGPAGTGKSAVAQTFAEICLAQDRLGAAYFFFRASGRDDPRTVIPSLAYQLAVNVPDYGNLLGHAIALDPSIFQKNPRLQLRRLIVEPFARLQALGHRSTQTPLLIILDGLDECKGTQSQCEFVEMIGEVVRLKRDLPLLWLIASRPEPHLQHTFSRIDFPIDYRKGLLLIDADTRDDVDRYLRESFDDIRTRFPLETDVSWPSEAQSRMVEDIASGLFALAATIVRYISDITYGDPVGRLACFLAFMTNANHATTANPLQTLDLLYTQILSEIPEDVYPTTRRIISFYNIFESNFSSLQCSCNFFCMDKHEFYNALSRFHALFDIPSSDRAVETNLRMHHASFREYLLSPCRSGRFHISGRDSLMDCFKMLLFWYKTILKDPRYVSDGSFRMVAKSTILRGLKWPSNDHANDLAMSRAIVWAAYDVIWLNFMALSHDDAEEIVNEFEDFDFRYILVNADDNGKFARFAEWLFACGSRNTLLHTEPQDELEEMLLEKVIREVGQRMEPAIFPMAMMSVSITCINASTV
ncbi:hypothetical protein Agabi119p4_3927 [Agaricus bisporus var. burnettii]|uniref:Nephrocystin 3-like N-terminal domain-containing protein n=1 Tax=Agaricus bisporus var. burnettii TaxID=192524 RepID=A0A8H7F5V3_AGABI|nr:hypothetical protein Agabi119p4_3927 [Agaricus bisporus var. burnettii]